jgi:hypothetical protein
MGATELFGILIAAVIGCAIVWLELGRDRNFLAAATVLIGALLVGGLVSVAIS